MLRHEEAAPKSATAVNVLSSAPPNTRAGLPLAGTEPSPPASLPANGPHGAHGAPVLAHRRRDDAAFDPRSRGWRSGGWRSGGATAHNHERCPARPLPCDPSGATLEYSPTSRAEKRCPPGARPVVFQRKGATDHE
jgi:hypothetical protein